MRIITGQGVLTGATGTFTVGVGGSVSRVYGIEFIPDGAAPGTTVYTVTNMGRTVFTSPASASTIYYPIQEAAFGTNGVVLTTGNPYVEPVVNGTITVAVSGAAAGTYSIVIFLYED